MKLYPFCANAGADSVPADKMIAASNRTMRLKATSRCRFCVWNAALIGTIMDRAAQAQSGATFASRGDGHPLRGAGFGTLTPQCRTADLRLKPLIAFPEHGASSHSSRVSTP